MPSSPIRFIRTLVWLLAATLLPAFAGSGTSEAARSNPPASRTKPPSRILAVVGGLLIDGTGAAPVPDSVVIIDGDRIVASGPRHQVRIPPGAVAVDATDLTVLPGLIDMHTHLIPGVDVGTFLRYGITSVRHMGDTTLEWIENLKAEVESGRRAGPRIFHCGRFVVSEPPLNRAIYPEGVLKRYEIMHGPGDARKVIEELKKAGSDLVKVKAHMTPECLAALCKAAAEAGLPVSFDSSGGNSYDAMDALEAGAKGVEHLSGIDFDKPGEPERVMNKMLEVGAFADPTFAVLTRTFGEARLEARREFIRRFNQRGGLVVAGTDTPTQGTPVGASLHEELLHLTESGLTPMEAISAATGGAARALGYQGLVGTIEAGAYADLLIVRGSPQIVIQDTRNIQRVFKGGVQVWARPGLSKP